MTTATAINHIDPSLTAGLILDALAGHIAGAEWLFHRGYWSVLVQWREKNGDQDVYYATDSEATARKITLALGQMFEARSWINSHPHSHSHA